MASVETLRAVPLFADLRDRDLKDLADKFGEKRYPAGTTVVEEGRQGIAFFVVDEGTATVTVQGEPHRTLGPGDTFGEVALFDGEPRSATVVADTELVCQSLAGWDFGPWLRRRPEVAWEMLRTMATRLREAEAAH